MSTDAQVGAKARELVKALSDFSAMLAVGAPTPLLAGQVEVLNGTVSDILDLCPDEWAQEDGKWTDALLEHQSKLLELVMFLQST